MQWIKRPLEDESVVDRLVQQGDRLHPALGRVLALRGVDSKEEARRFFRGSLADLSDPMLMCGMEAGAGRLARAIRDQERIMVYGDYDVDGTSAVALLVDFLQRRLLQPQYLVPSRFKGGYGLQRQGIDEAVRTGCTLLIVVDCGIKAVGEVAYANSQGLDVIICDHHEPEGPLPDAWAVIDPKQAGCKYPFKELCACTVAYKLAQATASKLGLDLRPLEGYLDLVALATVADVVPLAGENRILVREGLKALAHTRRPGLRALLDISVRNEGVVRSSEIGFQLGPRINAAGRMETADSAVRLFLTQNAGEGARLAAHLDQLNKQRKAVAEQLAKEAGQEAKVQVAGAHDGALVLHGRNWHIGVLGIIAGRIAERFARPTIVLSGEGRLATGSARTYGSIDIHAAISACSDLLVKFGGHTAAAGLTVPVGNILPLRRRLSAFVKERMRPEDLEPKCLYDAEVSVGDIDTRFVQILLSCEPCGNGNEQPLFRGRSIRGQWARTLSGGRHLKFQAMQTGGRRGVDAIAFGLGDKFDLINGAQPVDMLFTVEENHYMGRVTNQLNVKDIRPSRVES